MKRTLIVLALLTSSLYAATDVVTFRDLVGPHSSHHVFADIIRNHPIVVIECLSPGCPKCRNVASGFDALAEKYREKVLFIKMDVRGFDDIADAFALKTVPTFIIYVQGKQYKKIRGSGNLNKVAHYVSQAVKKLT